MRTSWRSYSLISSCHLGNWEVLACTNLYCKYCPNDLRLFGGNPASNGNCPTQTLWPLSVPHAIAQVAGAGPHRMDPDPKVKCLSHSHSSSLSHSRLPNFPIPPTSHTSRGANCVCSALQWAKNWNETAAACHEYLCWLPCFISKLFHIVCLRKACAWKLSAAALVCVNFWRQKTCVRCQLHVVFVAKAWGFTDVEYISYVT